ncbi:hypothetical protein NLX71_05740 [Paenibacillus sp. MZ04-78.2]|uniref:hypothetical protein n=1 Tax=Paenibacillus sp. MZ04-78.2 TaxID=2962034 RepID=UPI0020B6FE8B|nr:hypothetical protein [Paenibacillus sp. MZ04-78.2]MCP3772823.1 hypothetical protein [Paenibacillus sp. MZ04-78.2]
MIGSIRWNFIVGAAAFVITFALSITDNIWLTTLIRSFYSFVLMFVIVFLFRWLLGTVAGFAGASIPEHSEEEDELKGTAINVVTPDQDAELHQMLKPSPGPKDAADTDFSPLNPPKLSTKIQGSPDELAQAVRRMSEE